LLVKWLDQDKNHCLVITFCNFQLLLEARRHSDQIQSVVRTTQAM
jgi:hypothetical protein